MNAGWIQVLYGIRQVGDIRLLPIKNYEFEIIAPAGMPDKYSFLINVCEKDFLSIPDVDLCIRLYDNLKARIGVNTEPLSKGGKFWS